jgi:hypothetical protein
MFIPLSVYHFAEWLSRAKWGQEPISVEAGQIVKVLLGAFHVDGSFTIWDAAGERWGA